MFEKLALGAHLDCVAVWDAPGGVGEAGHAGAER